MSKRKLNIQYFIEQNRDWEKILSEKPYSLTITRDEIFGRKLVMLKYNQIESDFSIGIVRECRGIVLDEETLEVVSYGFNKFFNAGESNCAVLDASTMRSTEKIDGSLIKIVNLDGNLLISTNGTINAFNAPIAEQLGCEAKSFGDLVKIAVKLQYEWLLSSGQIPTSFSDPMEWFKSNIHPGYTYMFELVSPYSRVCIYYPDTRIYFIGFRNNSTFEESFFKDLPIAQLFPTPQIYYFNSFDACAENAKNLPWDKEGYVVMDANFNRAKVKSPAWLAAHHLCNNHVMSYSRALELVRLNEVDEVVAYFPEFKDSLMEVKAKYEDYVNKMTENLEKLKDWMSTHSEYTRKDIALFITSIFKNTSGFAFAYIDGKSSGVEEWNLNIPIKNLTKTLGYKTDD